MLRRQGPSRETMQADRLNLETPYGDVIVRTGQRKVLRKVRRILSAVQAGHRSNRSIDATVSFYGQYVAINQQVTLQNQDPRNPMSIACQLH